MATLSALPLPTRPTGKKMTAKSTPGTFAHAIAMLLYQQDPMRTGCSDCDEMQDEYEHEAAEISKRIQAGMETRQAIAEVFDFWFWEDCLRSSPDDSRIDALALAIEAIPPRP